MSKSSTVGEAKLGAIPLPSRPLVTRKDIAPLYASINKMRGVAGINVTVSEEGIVIGMTFDPWIWFNQHFETETVDMCKNGDPSQSRFVKLRPPPEEEE